MQLLLMMNTILVLVAWASPNREKREVSEKFKMKICVSSQIEPPTFYQFECLQSGFDNSVTRTEMFKCA